MFSRIVTTLGWIGLACAIGYFIFADKSRDPKAKANYEYVHQTQQILLVSGGMVIGGHLLRFLGGVVGLDSGRCKKCKKRIPKSEMFCFDHQKEIIWNSKERTRTAGITKHRLQ